MLVQQGDRYENLQSRMALMTHYYGSAWLLMMMMMVMVGETHFESLKVETFKKLNKASHDLVFTASCFARNPSLGSHCSLKSAH